MIIGLLISNSCFFLLDSRDVSILDITDAWPLVLVSRIDRQKSFPLPIPVTPVQSENYHYCRKHTSRGDWAAGLPATCQMRPQEKWHLAKNTWGGALRVPSAIFPCYVRNQSKWVLTFLWCQQLVFRFGILAVAPLLWKLLFDCNGAIMMRSALADNALTVPLMNTIHPL